MDGIKQGKCQLRIVKSASSVKISRLSHSLPRYMVKAPWLDLCKIRDGMRRGSELD